MAEIGHSDNLPALYRVRPFERIFRHSASGYGKFYGLNGDLRRLSRFFTDSPLNSADRSCSASAIESASASLRTSLGTHSGKAIRLDACAPLLVCSSQTFASWLFRNRGASLTKAGQSRR